MTQEQYFKNLTVPDGKIDIILDTDAYNEIFKKLEGIHENI